MYMIDVNKNNKMHRIDICRSIVSPIHKIARVKMSYVLNCFASKLPRTNDVTPASYV